MSTTLSYVTDKRTTQRVDPHNYVVIENNFLGDGNPNKKSLKIQKGLSYSVNRRTDHTMAKRRKGQTMIYKTYTKH